jgi:5-methylcytosine-specific restriction endonuclease McrA
MKCVRCGSTERYKNGRGRRNRDAVSATRRRWRAEHPEAHVASEHSRRALKRNAGGSYSVAEWVGLCEFFGWRCLRCGCDGLKLTVDHVIPLSRGGSNRIANIQPLCGPCNSAKGTNSHDYRVGALVPVGVQETPT